MSSGAASQALQAPWERSEFRRWTTAAAVVCALHLLSAAVVLHWPKGRISASDAPPAVLIELAPIPVAPETSQLDLAPGPDMKEAQPQQQPEKKPEEKAIVPDLPKQPEAEVQLPPPAPEKPEQQKPQDAQKAIQKNDPQKSAAPQTTAAPKANLKKAERQAAPAAGNTADSQAALATWRGALNAHLNRFKRPVAGAAGTVVVAFSVDAGGRVSGARLISSSRNSAADADAVAMVLRASPVPSPPPSMSKGGNISITVPVRYVR